MTDNYDENTSRIVVPKYHVSDSEEASRIIAKAQVISDYRDDYDMVKIAEIQYEKMRAAKNTASLKMSLESDNGPFGGFITGSMEGIAGKIFGKSDDPVSSGLKKARALLSRRAVGPMEQIPVEDYLQGGKERIKFVLTHTQNGAEQRYMAKLATMNGNQWHYMNQYRIGTPSTVGDPTIRNVIRSQEYQPGSRTYVNPGYLRTNLEADGRNAEQKLDGVTKEIINKWKPEKFGTEYSRAEALKVHPVVDEFFNFSITNMAFDKPTPVRFPAHILHITEGVSPSWNSISLINRSEDIYIYQRADRTFNLEFIVVATCNDNLKDPTGEFPAFYDVGGGLVGMMSKKMMWDRLEFIQTLARPSYKKDGTYDKAPYCRLNIGGLYVNQTVIFDNININFDPLQWDINPDPNSNKGDEVRPMIAIISTSGKFIHNTSPDVNTKFYGVHK